MLIDTHCHIDQFPSPESVVRECETDGIRVVAVTRLPSHFAMAADRLRGHPLVTPALGMHPLSAGEGIRELAAFRRMAPHANFIGEIGLDFSKHGEKTKSIQERVFDEVLCAIKDRPRFITLHSRGAEMVVLQRLRQSGVRSAVFHWFSGSAVSLDQVLAEGHLVSVNPAMLSSVSGQRVMTNAPLEQVLVESDGPFTTVEGRVCSPTDVARVYSALAVRWKVPIEHAVECIQKNFERIETLALQSIGP